MGDLDVIWNVPAADFDRLRADDRFTMTAAPWSGGALSLFQGTFVHELVHDARHLLGSPCH